MRKILSDILGLCYWAIFWPLAVIVCYWQFFLFLLIAVLAFAVGILYCGCTSLERDYARVWAIEHINGLDRDFKTVIEPHGIVAEVPKWWVKNREGYYWYPDRHRPEGAPK